MRENCVKSGKKIYRHFFTDVTDKVDFHMFKKGIKPVWEDAANCKVS